MSAVKNVGATRAGRQSGPKTARGKASSSRNAQKHGLLSRDLILPGESREEFDDVVASLIAELRPVGLLERSLVERIAVSLWRQRRLVKAESAGIELRATEKFGPAVLEFRNYLGDAARITDAQKALEREGDASWVAELSADIAKFDPLKHASLDLFAKACPLAYDYLKSEADRVRYPVRDYLQTKFGNLGAFVEYWKDFLERSAHSQEIVALFRESRRLPNNPDVLIRYQSGLDNEVYKAMRALREAQTYRLATIEVVPGEGGG